MADHLFDLDTLIRMGNMSQEEIDEYNFAIVDEIERKIDSGETKLLSEEELLKLRSESRNMNAQNSIHS